MNKLEILSSPRLTTQTEHVKRSFYAKDSRTEKMYQSNLIVVI